jgi:hypothetical protein
MFTGVALLFAAGFFEYMLELFQHQIFGMTSTTDVSPVHCSYCLKRKEKYVHLLAQS